MSLFDWNYYDSVVIFYSKSMKIPKGKLEDLIPRMTDNTMAKRKRTKGQTTNNKTLHRKLKIEQHESQKKTGWSWVLRKIKAVPAPLMAPVV